METYNNDYSKDEDHMMWELHEIRNELAKENPKTKDINAMGEIIIKKYGLKKIKTFKDKKVLSIKAS